MPSDYIMENDGLPETIMLMRDHAVQLMSIAVMIRTGELCIRTEDFADSEIAHAALVDIGQDCALQLGGLG